MSTGLAEVSTTPALFPRLLDHTHRMRVRLFDAGDALSPEIEAHESGIEFSRR